jgi:hypothetical protein
MWHENGIGSLVSLVNAHKIHGNKIIAGIKDKKANKEKTDIFDSKGR